jgi:hypothetical protein
VRAVAEREGVDLSMYEDALDFTSKDLSLVPSTPKMADGNGHQEVKMSSSSCRQVDSLRKRFDRPKTIDEWKADPTVLSVVEEGLPPGWAKIVKKSGIKKKCQRAFFKSPTKSCMQ